MSVIAIAAGGSHSLALTKEGAVFSFGRGIFGQLGHGNREDQLNPKVIEALCGRRVVAIAAGERTSMALNADGVVYSFGWGPHGMLGHGDPSTQLVPKPIEPLRNRHVVAVSVGREHTLVLTDEGIVLSFGYGGYGLLGHGDEKSELVPKAIEALHGRCVVAISAGRRVVAISAGAEQSLVLTIDGAVLSFGCRGAGFRDCQYEPTVVEALRDVRAATIVVGIRIMVLTDEGVVLSLKNGVKNTTLWTLARLH